jgi:UDP-glucose 4-epimerase
VKEVIQMVERVSKMKVPHDIGPRRVGDPPFLVADFEKARRYLQWTPNYGLQEIVESAWAYHTKFGFEA